ncbi:chromate transporter [Mycoplasma iguanae]|uniref:Chromate transporter n=1 Tax=Mycoplasma iguanae TaxID=292461 RepID=A0ABY5RA63_9MOLU|nr:chromate transporter [Mycoplasma iguanae]UVD81669.1 chromate transporter [Mycoplasma iguanae]
MKKANFWNVFVFILKVTFLGFGGGNALMPIIEKYAVTRYKWMDKKTLEEGILIVNVLPGPSVVEIIAYISINLLGKWKGMLVTLLGILPSLFFTLAIIISFNYLPKEYIYVINVGVISSIIGVIIAFGYRYIKMSHKELSIVRWLSLFVFTCIFIIFVPNPWNISSIPIIIVILGILFHYFVIYKRKERRK